MLKLAFVFISRSCWLWLCCGLTGWWRMLMQVTLVSYWVACVMTWGPPYSSSSLSSLPSLGRAGGFCVPGASACLSFALGQLSIGNVISCASTRSSVSSICTMSTLSRRSSWRHSGTISYPCGWFCMDCSGVRSRSPWDGFAGCAKGSSLGTLSTGRGLQWLAVFGGRS